MKTILGYLAILLGAVGFLVALALIGGAWWGASQVKARSQQVTTQADKSLAEVEDGLERLRKQLASTAEAVDSIRAAADKAADDKPNTGPTRIENERLRNRLMPQVERADAVSEALSPVAQMVENAANLAEQAGGKPHADRLRAIAGKARAAAKELEAARKDAVAMGQSEFTPGARQIANLAEKTRKPLDTITAALTDLKTESEALRKDLPEARRAVDQWAVTGPAILTGLLVWVGLGQLALIGWGRRCLAPPPAPTPPPTIRK